MNDTKSSSIKLGQLALVIAICFGLFILISIQAVMSDFPVTPFQDASIWGICLFEILMAAFALLVLYFSRYDIRSLFPEPSWRGALHGVLLAAAAFLVTWLLAQAFGENDPAVAQIGELVSQSYVTWPAALALSAVNGTYEEVFLCGYILRAVEGAGASTAIGVSALVRVLYHLYQGPFGALAVLGFGLVTSIYYWRTRKLWPVVFAHGIADLIALV